MNIVKKYQFACTECGELTKQQNKRPMADGCQRRRYCENCGNTYVIQYNKSNEFVRVVNAYKKVNIVK